jgi:hypothetical protein
MPLDRLDRIVTALRANGERRRSAPKDIVQTARAIDRTYGFALHAGHEPLTGVCRACRNATTDSTSMGMLRGSSDVPIAERAQRPRSGPYTSMMRSENPLTTSG